MDTEKILPKRKHPRLDHYDYSSAGAYFVTICTQNKQCVLSRIVAHTEAVEKTGYVGQGLAPAALYPTKTVGRGLAPAEIITTEYTTFGEIAEKQLLLLDARYPHLTVDQYVIMPDHIHAIMVLNQAARASPRPTITDIVCTYKSLTARECRQNGLEVKLFQASFYEHIIRNQEDYENIVNYIYENPLRRYLRSL